MNHDEFDKLLEQTIKDIRCVMSSKSKEYSKASDKLHNFKRAGEMLRITPEKALLGMKAKHDISILDIVDKIEDGLIPDYETVDEKLGDAINYLILLKALLYERIYKERVADLKSMRE